MNKTGELPFQSEFNVAKYQLSLPDKPIDSSQKFNDGGLIGVSRMSNANVEKDNLSIFNKVIVSHLSLKSLL